MPIIKLLGRDTAKVRIVRKDIPYKETRADGEPNKLFGQFYHQYKFNNKLICLNTTDEYHLHHGKLAELDLIEDEEGNLSIGDYVTKAEAVAEKKFDTVIKSYDSLSVEEAAKLDFVAA